MEKLSAVKFKDLALGVYGIGWAAFLLAVYLSGPKYFEGVVVFGGLGYAVVNLAFFFLDDFPVEEVARALFT